MCSNYNSWEILCLGLNFELVLTTMTIHFFRNGLLTCKSTFFCVKLKDILKLIILLIKLFSLSLFRIGEIVTIRYLFIMGKIFFFVADTKSWYIFVFTHRNVEKRWLLAATAATINIDFLALFRKILKNFTLLAVIFSSYIYSNKLGAVSVEQNCPTYGIFWFILTMMTKINQITKPDYLSWIKDWYNICRSISE